MQSKFMFALLGLCAWAMITTQAQAGPITVNLQATDDVVVEDYWSTTYTSGYYSYSSSQYMELLWSTNSNNHDYRLGYIQFDLSSIPDSAAIVSMSLSVRAAHVSYLTSYLVVHRVDDDAWTEDSMTWSNKPGTVAQVVNNDAGSWSTDTNTLWATAGLQPTNWNMTSELADNVLSLRLYCPLSNTVAYFAHEAGPDSAPTLSITYIPEPATVALLAGGSTVIMGRRAGRRARDC